MNLFRKIFGLGPKEPANIRPRKTTTPIKTIENVDASMSYEDILPVLVSVKTKEYDLVNEIAATFHERENNYANVIIAHVMVDRKDLDRDGEPELYHIKNGHENEDFYITLEENGQRNFDDFEIPFEFWNPTDKKLAYKVLSSRVSFFASEKIMSKKHMLEAHKTLNAKKLLVSIPRKGLIFVCDKNIEEEHYNHFLNMHAYVVLQENEDLEFLCEDIFIVENGEIKGTLNVQQLSDKLSEIN